jgi:tryptophanyl-tRNA synthetase
MTQRILSGIQPTGAKHIGNYIGAIRHYVAQQSMGDAMYFLADLHALTVAPDPAELRAATLDTAAMLIAAGLEVDPREGGVTLFAQSHVGREHALGAWLLECVATMGELKRMTQYKEKTGSKADGSSVGLFAYPVLQAADILLYDIDVVPVGDDQKQHLELTRDIAQRVNSRYGEGTVVVPRPLIHGVGARILDLQDPTRKMSTSNGTPKGPVFVLDEPDVIVKKFKSEVTDSGSEVFADPAEKPGVTNLLDIMHVATGRDVDDLVGEYRTAGYGTFKLAVAEALVEHLRPIRERHAELMGDTAELERILAAGAERARELAGPKVDRLAERMGLLPLRVHAPA